MTGPLRFQFDPEKFIQAAAYVTAAKPDSMTRTKLFKLLYFADRDHLLKYARPILKDIYINMDQGPVPSAAYDLLKGNTVKWDDHSVERFRSVIHVEGKNITLRSNPGSKLLSRSELSVLDEVIEKYGNHGASYLSALSHRDKAWQQSQRNRPIDYNLFFESEDLNRTHRIALSNQAVRDLVMNRPSSKQRTT